jgi:hypothetical protein
MQRYAIIQNGLVVNVIEYETAPSNPPPAFDETHIAVQSDIAGPGFTYANGVFTPPLPYPSWVLENNVWVAPIPFPTDGGRYFWDENTKNWIKVI